MKKSGTSGKFFYGFENFNKLIMNIIMNNFAKDNDVF
jgi:hypothetical protein